MRVRGWDGWTRISFPKARGCRYLTAAITDNAHSLAAYLAADVPLEDAIRRAGAVASLSVQRAGTQTSYLKAAELRPELRLP